MKTKKLQWPVAKVREDGTPAIWLTFTNWLVIRDGVVREYLRYREACGERKGKLETNTLEAWENFGFERSQADAALELYSAGHAAHGHVGGGDPMTPARLVELGDAREKKGYADYLVQFSKTPTGVLRQLFPFDLAFTDVRCAA